jgi:hypothetical protein
MEQANCLNCGAVVTAAQNFCYNCGQKTDISRITFRSLLHDFLLVFAHADRGILNLVKGLTINPGKTVVEYIQGKRKKYFNPFGFLGLCIAFMVFMNNWIKPYNDLPSVDPQVMARIPDENLRQLYVLSIERNVRAQKFVNNNLNIASVLVAPYFALMLWLFFKKRGRNIAEITVTYILFTGFANVLSTTLISPWMAYYRNSFAHDVLLYSSIFLQTLYFVWGLNVFFGYKSVTGYMKVLGALFIIGLIGFIVVLITLFFYLYQGESFKVLKYL